MGICLPFKVTKLNSGPNPRTATLSPSTLLLSIPTPTTLASDSAKFPSGNLPKSSAVIASTTPTLLLLIAIASFRLALMPTTTTSSSTSDSVGSSEISELEKVMEKINATIALLN